MRSEDILDVFDKGQDKFLSFRFGLGFRLGAELRPGKCIYVYESVFQDLVFLLYFLIWCMHSIN